MALTGALISQRMYFSELVEGNPLMSALEPSSGLLGKEYAKDAEAESDHHLHIRAVGARSSEVAEGLWRVSLEAVDAWTRPERGRRRDGWHCAVRLVIGPPPQRRSCSTLSMKS